MGPCIIRSEGGKMNRKGFIFTMLAIIVTGIIVAFALIGLESVDAGQSALRDATMLRIMSSDIEDDITRGLYITSFRTLIGQIEKTITTGNFLSSTNETFNEGMINGTIEGSGLDILENATFTDWLAKMTDIIEKKGYRIDYDILLLEQFQEGPWHVSSRIVIDYNLSNPGNSRGYQRRIDITERVSIRGLEDPFYYIFGLGRLTNSIIISDDNDILFLINASEDNSLYIENNMSNSFLQRLEGDFTSSPHGIESIVGGQRFKDQGIAGYDGRSSIDFMFFSGAAAEVQCVVGAPEWFRIDKERIPFYTNLVNVSC
jgi:hypothetical protein